MNAFRSPCSDTAVRMICGAFTSTAVEANKNPFATKNSSDYVLYLKTLSTFFATTDAFEQSYCYHCKRERGRGCSMYQLPQGPSTKYRSQITRMNEPGCQPTIIPTHQTSVFEVNMPSKKASGGIHFTGSMVLPPFR